LKSDDEYSLRDTLPFEYVQNYDLFKADNQYPQSFLPYLSLYIFSSFQIDHKVKKVEFMQVKFGKNPGSGGMIGGG